MDSSLTNQYTNASQKARVITESWVERYMFCPRCGNERITHFPNNKPVADFYCPKCLNQFELKSKEGATLRRINDGAYSTMIERITGMNNPNFFFMSYSKSNWTVQNFFFVPKHFFSPAIIEKRTPLSSTAKRAGWTGCNILLEKIPETGRISIIKDGIIIDQKKVLEEAAFANRLAIGNINARGWLFDVLSCIERIPIKSFSLHEVYMFEAELKSKHPMNKNIKAKIRQQLQILRDNDVIEFVGKGQYRKIS